MKKLQTWFDEYAVSHQNKTNQLIHYICVPAIFFSIVGMFMSIPATLFTNTFNIQNAIIGNWATILLVIVLLFYLRLSFSSFLKMFIFSAICLIGNRYLSNVFPLFYVSLTIFVIAWIGQFYGHKLEGKKPSFFKDLQFLLIGPAWVFEKLTNNNR